MIVGPAAPAPDRWAGRRSGRDRRRDAARSGATRSTRCTGTGRSGSRRRRAAVFGRRAARARDRAGPPAVRALAPLRVRRASASTSSPARTTTTTASAAWCGVRRSRRTRLGAVDVRRRRRRCSTTERRAWCDGGPRARRHRGPRRSRARSIATTSSNAVLARRPSRHAPNAELAADQLAAVVHDTGAARVIAPAGSGKTRVLTERFRLLVDRGWSPGSITAVAYNVRAKDTMQARLARHARRRAQRRVRTLHTLGNDVLRRAGGNTALIDEWEMRRRIEALVPVKPRANTDMYAPYLDALSEVRLGLVDPNVVEAQRDDVAGFGAMFDEYRDKLARRPRHRSRRTDLRRDRGPAARARRPPRVPARGPAPARRRVPGPHARATAPAAPRRRARVRRLRRRRRRPGDLRLRGRRSRVPHQLRPLLPRRHASRARDELPLPGAGRRRDPQPALVQPAPHRQGDRRGRSPTRAPTAPTRSSVVTTAPERLAARRGRDASRVARRRRAARPTSRC